LAEREPTAVSFVIFGTLLWDCVVGALMLLIAFSTFLVMLLAAVVLVWFILSFPLKVASLVRRNWLPADLNLTT
jgi:hypothetical protein